MTERSERKSLSLRIFVMLFAVALLTFLATAAIVVYFSWTVYEGDAEQRLSSQVSASSQKIANKSQAEMTRILADERLAGTRITLVAPDGTVLYDSDVNAESMENHGDREEVNRAAEANESVVLRRSETTGTDTLYAACLVDDTGTVLRLSETRASLANYLGSLSVILAVAMFAAVALSLALARIATRLIIAPLLAVDLETPLESKTYREIDPLIQRIDTQRSELVAQNAQLEEAMQMRREFTGNVSHEMKSPLQIIGGYAELIEGGVTNEEDTRKFAGLIRSESQSMRALIDDVLMLSRLDERASTGLYAVNVARVCKDVIERLSHSAAEKGARIVFAGEDSLLALGANELLEQAVYNLLDNAIRHGGTSIEVMLLQVGEKIRVVISDNGPGIPSQYRTRIFERFYRIDASRSRDTGGTGLGLAIVKHAVESMGGVVFVEDSKLGGAAFIIELCSAD